MSDDDLDFSEEFKRNYYQNQDFLNRIIFGVSSFAIPFLYATAFDNSGFYAAIFLAGSLISFLTVIILQIWSLICARDGCDASLNSDADTKKRGIRLTEKAKRIDKYRNGIFILALILIILSVISNIINMRSDTMSKGKENKPLSSDLQINSFTPPTSTTEQQKPSQSQASQNGNSTSDASENNRDKGANK